MTTNARPTPAWDEEAVVEAVARALFQRTYPGSTAWDTLPVDEFGKEVWRESARELLAVVREHLPVKPDREAGRSEAEAKAEALREAADEVERIDPEWDSALWIADPTSERGGAYHPVETWLRERADRLAAEGGAS